jgi:hypothetical protein
MAIADEAATGIGFMSPNRLSRFSLLFLEESGRLMQGGKTRYLQLPVSLCCAVPPSEACVQPKARTPQVGCTLRALSHNLALLPPNGEVETIWHLGPVDRVHATEPLNLLLVPGPYKIGGTAFRGVTSAACRDRRHGLGRTCGGANFFSIEQPWLTDKRSPLSAGQITRFLSSLIKAAKVEVREIGGVILPELALSRTVAQKTALHLASRFGLELFVSGVSTSDAAAMPRNAAYAAFFGNGEPRLYWLQSKHHRWKLERDQICRYQLGDALDPDHAWWERADISGRKVYFREFRDGATLATLICEDLARVDPVQPAVRAIGPNLVVALLMDGPQLPERWSARYATVLADDPGSSVLTLTCLGMVERSWTPGQRENRQVALWKEPGQAAKELVLPAGAHGLLLSLCVTHEENFTLDGRSDGEASYRVSMAGVQPVWTDV